MRVCADRVSLDGPHATLLPATSLTVNDGELAFVHGEPGLGITAFGLALVGRLRPTTGTVMLHEQPGELADIAALVDAPAVSEPDGALPLRVVVGEELALARRRAGKDQVVDWLAEHDLAGRANTRFENLEPETRTRLLTTLAASRHGIRLLVLDRPDRHTSRDTWSPLAYEYAERGFAVVVLLATTSAHLLPTAPAQIGELQQPAPMLCRVATDEVSAEPTTPEETEEGHR